MDKETRWKLRFENFASALNSLKEINEQNSYDDDIIVDAGIQRFEVTFELAWKTLQDYLAEEGFSTPGGPKSIIKQSVNRGLIEDGDAWLEMLKDRNSLSHEYIYTESRNIFNRIINLHFQHLESLFNQLKNE